MNEKERFETIVKDAQDLQVPSNRFYHRHFLLHEAGNFGSHCYKRLLE